MTASSPNNASAPMTEQAFAELAAQGYDRIPLVAEVPADLDTPLSLYLKLARRDDGSRAGTFLLESVVGGERFGRYSFIGLPARTWVRTAAGSTDGRRIEVVRDGEVIETHEGDPLEFVRAYRARTRPAPRAGGGRLPRFCGGLAGYFGYDIVRHVEPRLAAGRKPDPLGVPEILLLAVDELAIVDNLSGKLSLVVWADPAEPEAFARAQARLATLKARLAEAAVPPAQSPSAPAEVIRDFAKDDFLAAVDRVKEYVAAGDVMQVVIGQCLKKPFAHHPLTLYRALRSLNPSPYMYYYDFGDFHVAGSSPEILVRQELAADGATTVTVRPIAGTRRRGATPEEDLALEQELLADQKERAEHLMLIDLARNDVGRIAEIGSVRVTESMVVERYSHVMHIVSNVEGRLRQGLDDIDVLRATFPAGTLSGAPKVRAMEIIDEVEPIGRAVYGGACGYLSYGGEMDVAIAIRTGIVKDGTLYAQAGAGIVHDSVPESEWLETETKARAILRAAELVEQGL